MHDFLVRLPIIALHLTLIPILLLRVFVVPLFTEGAPRWLVRYHCPIFLVGQRPSLRDEAEHLDVAHPFLSRVNRDDVFSGRQESVPHGPGRYPWPSLYRDLRRGTKITERCMEGHADRGDGRVVIG